MPGKSRTYSLERRDREIVVPPREVDVGGLVEVTRLGAGRGRALGDRCGSGSRRRLGAAAARRGPDRVELERQRVDAAPELVDPTLKLPRLATEVVEARAQSRDAPLDFGQGLGRPAIGRLDLGQEGGAASLNLLLHPQEIGAEPVKILVEEGGGLRGAPCE